MQLASFTDYGLRILIKLSETPDQPQTTAALAKTLNVSYHHLTKVVLNLAHAGYITSRRGATGGIKLARPANKIKVGEVVRLLEQRFPVVECFRTDGGKCTLTRTCHIRRSLAAAQEAFIRELNKTTIANHPLPRKPEGASP